MPTTEQVRAVFEHFEQGNAAAFFEHVVDNVEWQVKGRW
jgi:ketosteroid isomerase-like protein